MLPDNALHLMYYIGDARYHRKFRFETEVARGRASQVVQQANVRRIGLSCQ